MNTPADLSTSAAMQGFAQEFTSLDDYIRVITHRVWEGRQIESIRDYYSDPCPVITPSGATTDVQSVINGTKATLAQFPDRRLLAEDVIESGNAQTGFLSSHRIISTMTHLGDGNFGKASGKKIQVRTVADCVCKDNRIVYEWLVRDQAAIALAIGIAPKELAREWLAARGSQELLPLPQPAAPLWWRNPISNEPIAQAYAQAVGVALRGEPLATALYDEAVCSLGPGNSMHYGHAEVQGFYANYAAAMNARSYEIQSNCFMPASSTTGRPPRMALRWRIKGVSTGLGKFAGDVGKPIEILGIQHAEFIKLNGRWQVHREWVLIDEIAIWMQLQNPVAKKE